MLLDQLVAAPSIGQTIDPVNGYAARIAGNLRSYWRNARMLANTIMPNRFFDELGLPRLGR